MVAGTGTGRVIAGRYRLLGPVGRGAMGIVWRGRDELLHRDVAVKQVQITALTLPAEAELAYQRTLREARTAARLSHPAVMTVFDVVEEDGSPWIIMELITGRSLEQVIAEDGPLPPGQAADLGLRLLGALTTAHAAGVLHRDVKPSNVLIGSDGRAVLTDFGIAMFAEDPGITQVGMVVGTPGFTSPERVQGGSATPASDLWSLGATLYAAVEGRGPFDRPGGSTAIIAGVADEEAPRAPSAGPLAPVIDALLRRDPAARPDGVAAARMLTAAAEAAETDPGYQGREARGGAGLSLSPAGPARPGHGKLGRASLGMASLSLGQLSRGGLARGSGAKSASEEPALAAAPATNDPAATFLDPPDYAELRMPGPADTQDEAPDAARPVLGAAVLEEAGEELPQTIPPGQGAPVPPTGPSARAAGGAWWRNWRMATAGGAVAAIVIAAAIGFGVYSRLLAAGTPADPGDEVSVTTAPSNTPGSHGHAAQPHPSRGPGSSGGTGVTQTQGPSQSGSPPAGGSHSPKPKSSPTPHKSQTKTKTKTKTKKPGNGLGTPPAGYSWVEVPASQVGATAGFAIAAPKGWTLEISGKLAELLPPTGPGRVVVNTKSFTFTAPVRQAHYEQKLAKKRDLGYRYGSVLPTEFMGASAAVSRFSYLPLTAVKRQDVLSELMILATSKGSQSYQVTLQTPAPYYSVREPVYEKMLISFQPLT
jgi:eukaryotic-like serine/threonine-protein kinase